MPRQKCIEADSPPDLPRIARPARGGQRAHSTRATHTADYLIGMALVADYLQEGLSLLGRSCDEFEL